MNYDLTSEVASKITYTASGTLMIFGFSLNDFAIILGMIIGVATFIINWYYKHKMAKDE
jgi:hypothetical protein